MQKGKVAILLKKLKININNHVKMICQKNSAICSSQKQDWRKFAHLLCCPKPSPCKV
jgi:hypothetical protein